MDGKMKIDKDQPNLHPLAGEIATPLILGRSPIVGNFFNSRVVNDLARLKYLYISAYRGFPTNLYNPHGYQAPSVREFLSRLRGGRCHCDAA